MPASIGIIQVFGRALLYFFEHNFNVHQANRTISCLIPLGLLALLAARWLGHGNHGLALVLLFVLRYGMGNGMQTIVKAVGQDAAFEKGLELGFSMRRGERHAPKFVPPAIIFCR